jgi:dihydroorotase
MKEPVTQIPPILIVNANIVNEGRVYQSDVLIRNGRIDKIQPQISDWENGLVIDARGSYLMPGLIDDQVHFREPGFTHKADIYTESRAAVAGGVTSYMEMPNTQPQATTQELLEEKYRLAAGKSLANYTFYMGTTNDNLEEVLKTDPERVCGIKIFMGSSTGDMLVDNPRTLEQVFSHSRLLIATHCEDEETIRRNSVRMREQYGEEVPIHLHPLIRSEEACYLSSSMAVELARKTGARLHVLHISTARELELFEPGTDPSVKRITAEACMHHLWFTDRDYSTHGSKIKWNPAVKTERDREALRRALLDGRIDVVATDHAPHTAAEKGRSYFQAPSGGPMVQHMLPVLMQLHHSGVLPLGKIPQLSAHNPAVLFRVVDRGFIREGYWADLVLVEHSPWTVDKENILYKCGWSPLEGQRFDYRISHTLVSGHLAYHRGLLDERRMGQRLRFRRE